MSMHLWVHLLICKVIASVNRTVARGRRIDKYLLQGCLSRYYWYKLKNLRYPITKPAVQGQTEQVLEEGGTVIEICRKLNESKTLPEVEAFAVSSRTSIPLQKHGSFTAPTKMFSLGDFDWSFFLVFPFLILLFETVKKALKKPKGQIPGKRKPKWTAWKSFLSNEGRIL